MGAIKLVDLDTEIFVPIYDEANDVTYEQIMSISDMFAKFMPDYKPQIVYAIPIDWLKSHAREYLDDWGVKPYNR